MIGSDEGSLSLNAVDGGQEDENLPLLYVYFLPRIDVTSGHE